MRYVVEKVSFVTSNTYIVEEIIKSIARTNNININYIFYNYYYVIIIIKLI